MNEFCLLFFWFSIFSLFFSYCNSAIVTTSFGQLDGDDVGEFLLFKRIPFAKPPVGKLRFQKPKAPEKWEGVRNAKEYGPACMSNSTTSTSPQKWVDEDCLHVNVFTSKKCLKSKDCAVVTYLHGGGLLYDSAVMFNDTYLLGTFVNQDVILVIPAFRLGIFSHFVVRDQSIAPNNLALYDIIHALEFVKSEIRNFGGDNKKVTIMGHSYGGSLTAILTFSTKINTDLSLFQRAISMSSGHDFQNFEIQEQKTRYFAEFANCIIPEDLGIKMTSNQRDLYMMKCLQNKDSHELLRLQRKLEEEGYPTFAFAIQREPLFQDVPYHHFMDTPKHVPMLTGCTRYEMDHAPADKPIGEGIGYENPIEVYAKYRMDLKNGNYDFSNHSDETQAIMVQEIIRAQRLQSNGVPVFLYEYTYPKHARHTDDLFYLMGVHRFERDENEEKLARVYERFFMNFAKYGEPGEGFEMANVERSSYYEVYWNETTGERPQMKDRFEERIINYWLKDMIEYDKNVTALKKKSLEPVKPALRFYKPTSEQYQLKYMFISIFIVSAIFMAGCLFGKYFCSNSKNRNLYIQIDGRDIPAGTVKNF
ncbi:hypothetical protein L5515_011060 [Caenorhabditis briggsae]|uniref:Carboxylesterase type B domain-containing protein n=1 Tax=Caenorhabditis briggsae TaxID=6238 RepID=A0AAE9JGG9_CAEBR|nr:hypothetical protein L5515_011060 [Caenorhabditis briggsae]